MKTFSIKDYYRMYKARGINFPIQYLFQNHLFDIRRKIDTHKRLEKRDYSKKHKDFDSGVLYIGSPTNELRRAFNILNNQIKIKDFQYFDLGCG